MTGRCEPPEHLRDVDGWHWVRRGDGGKPFIARWLAAPHSGLEPLWAEYGESATPAWAATHWDWRYLSPVATPAEVDALREKVKRAGQACFDAQQEALAARMDANEWCQKAQLWDDRVHRLRAEVASLRATLGHQPAAEGAEPIGCPIPGMCAAVTATATLRARVATLAALVHDVLSTRAADHAEAHSIGWVYRARAALDGVEHNGMPGR